MTREFVEKIFYISLGFLLGSFAIFLHAQTTENNKEVSDFLPIQLEEKISMKIATSSMPLDVAYKVLEDEKHLGQILKRLDRIIQVLEENEKN